VNLDRAEDSPQFAGLIVRLEEVSARLYHQPHVQTSIGLLEPRHARKPCIRPLARYPELIGARSDLDPGRLVRFHWQRCKENAFFPVGKKALAIVEKYLRVPVRSCLAK